MGGGVGISGGSFASISVWKVVHPENCLPFGKHKEYGRRSGRNFVIVRNPPRRFSIFSAFCFRTPRVRHIGTDKGWPVMEVWRVLLNHWRAACGTIIVLVKDGLILVICVTTP